MSEAKKALPPFLAEVEARIYTVKANYPFQKLGDIRSFAGRIYEDDEKGVWLVEVSSSGYVINCNRCDDVAAARDEWAERQKQDLVEGVEK